MNKTFGILIFTSLFILQRPAFAVDATPHISDREIVESLTAVRGDIKRLEDGQKVLDKGLNTRIDDLRSEIKGDIKRLEDGQKALDKGLNTRIDDLRSEIKGDIKRLEDGQKALDKGLNTRIDDLRSGMNGRFEEVNHRFDALQWMFGLFITIALVILGFVLRMQWQMQRRQTSMETVLETQREELSFIKKIIEKFIPPRGVL